LHLGVHVVVAVKFRITRFKDPDIAEVLSELFCPRFTFRICGIFLTFTNAVSVDRTRRRTRGRPNVLRQVVLVIALLLAGAVVIERVVRLRQRFFVVHR